MELIKTTIKLGNSAGVLLPKKYLNSQVKIVLEPLNIEKDVLDILREEGILKKVLGVYLVGSYAREEQSIESDTDVLVITSNLNKRIVKGKYELIYVSKKQLEEQLEKNALPIFPMIKEAKVIVNKELIRNYINAPLTKKNLRWHLETTKSALAVVKKDLEIAKELKEEHTSDSIAYSLILRLRTLHIVDCMKKNKLPTKKDFLKLIKKTTNSLEAYNGYLRAKNNQKIKSSLPIKETKLLVDYIDKNISKLEDG